MVTVHTEIAFEILPWCVLDIFLKVCSYNSGGHNNFMKTAGEKSDKTNSCVFYWELQGQCWFNWDLGSTALPRGIKEKDATRGFCLMKISIQSIRKLHIWIKNGREASRTLLTKSSHNLKAAFDSLREIILWLWKCWNIWKKINVAEIFTLKLMSGSDISNYFECFHANFFLHQ